MKSLLIIFLSFFTVINCSAQSISNYQSLDPSHPITFEGDYIVYQGKHIQLGPNAFFIDGQLSDEQVSKYKFVYNSINEAAKHLTDGTEEIPMVLYIAPYVYWIDDPDDPEVRVPKPGGHTPFGLEITCQWLRFYGLSDDPRNVVLASNRGQTMGAKGNFTMFNITGDGTSAENVTFGNYCNIDLNFPLKPELNRKKRGSAIVQAQLAFCWGDKLVARNTRFVSRLNLCPFYGGKRTFFDHCHFESTDDALAPKGVYLNCDFEFYGSKPFGHTEGTGAVLLNCKMKSFVRGEQYMIKGGGPITAIDCQMETQTATYWGWKEKPAKESRNYQYNDQFNGKPVNVGSHHPYSTVDMTGKQVLEAYRFVYNGKVEYNIYNLLRGDDDWDPVGMKPLVLEAQKENEKSYINLPSQLLIAPTQVKIETGKDSVLLKAQVNKFGDIEMEGVTINWSVGPEYASLVKLKVNNDGSCLVIPTNEDDVTKEVIVNASTPSGLEAASVLNVAPSFLPPPTFASKPQIEKRDDGTLHVNYKLDMRFKDQSLVSWYRCTNAKGDHPIEISVSRFNKPNRDHILSPGDIGYYIMAKVAPKHVRCFPGPEVSTIMANPISANDVKSSAPVLDVDLEHLSTKYQPKVIPGFWTLDCYAPKDTHDWKWEADNSKDPWYYGVGINGASSDTGLVQNNKGARLRYTPVGNKFGDMKMSFTACPAKTEGQGFSSARAQYMDICLKFDTKELNGYALRLVRTTKYHDAIDCILMKYENGNAVPISNPVSTTCYRTPCFITIEVKGNQLIAHMESPAKYYLLPNRHEVKQEVDLKTTITPNDFGGIEFQHTGTVGSGATLIKNLKIKWL